jgi:hypothetical protein
MSKRQLKLSYQLGNRGQILCHGNWGCQVQLLRCTGPGRCQAKTKSQPFLSPQELDIKRERIKHLAEIGELVNVNIGKHGLTRNQHVIIAKLFSKHQYLKVLLRLRLKFTKKSLQSVAFLPCSPVLMPYESEGARSSRGKPVDFPAHLCYYNCCTHSCFPSAIISNVLEVLLR